MHLFPHFPRYLLCRTDATRTRLVKFLQLIAMRLHLHIASKPRRAEGVSIAYSIAPQVQYQINLSNLVFSLLSWGTRLHVGIQHATRHATGAQGFGGRGASFIIVLAPAAHHLETMYFCQAEAICPAAHPPSPSKLLRLP